MTYRVFLTGATIIKVFGCSLALLGAFSAFSGSVGHSLVAQLVIVLYRWDFGGRQMHIVLDNMLNQAVGQQGQDFPWLQLVLHSQVGLDLLVCFLALRLSCTCVAGPARVGT